MAYLEIRRGQQSGKKIDLGRTISLGRHTGNNLILDDSRVSRYHARIQRRGEQFFVEDLSSSNGTFLGDRQLAPGILSELVDGDEIQVGTTCLTFHLYRFLSSSSEIPRPNLWSANPPKPVRQLSN